MIVKLTSNLDIYNNQERIFNDVCELIRQNKNKYPDVDYMVTLGKIGSFDPSIDKYNKKLPSHYKAIANISLVKNRIILEQSKGSGFWPCVCIEIVRVKSFFWYE